MEAGRGRACRPNHDSTFTNDKLHLCLRKQAVSLPQLLRDCHLAFARDLHVFKVLLSGITVKLFGWDGYAGAEVLARLTGFDEASNVAEVPAFV